METINLGWVGVLSSSADNDVKHVRGDKLMLVTAVVFMEGRGPLIEGLVK